MSDKRCKDCHGLVSGPSNFDGVAAYSCPQCGMVSSEEVEDVPRRTRGRWQPGCEVDNVGLGDTKLYNVSFRLTEEQYNALREAINTRLTLKSIVGLFVIRRFFDEAHTKAHK